MDCVNCGAPLEHKRDLCAFCGTLNDTDLRAIHRNTKEGPASERACPRCDRNLTTVDLRIDGKFLIERCNTCLGLFFDPNELEALLDKSVSGVYEADFTRLNILIEDEGKEDTWPVEYIKCPVCAELMHRRSYGSRSGVIADSCKGHGVWLDGGECGKLLRWTKAGGRIHDAKQKRQEERKKEREQKVRPTGLDTQTNYYDPVDHSPYLDFLGALGALVRMLLR